MKLTDMLRSQPPKTFMDMRIGQVAKVVDGDYSGSIILRVGAGWVSLTDPENTWLSGQKPGFVVEILPAGTRLTFSVDV